MSNQEKKIQEFLEEYYENSNEGLYKQANALENFAGLVEEIMDFRDNIEKRLTRIENVIATPRWLLEAEVKQNEEIGKLKIGLLSYTMVFSMAILETRKDI